MLKIVTVVGARPQFVKVSAVSRAITAHNSTAPEGNKINEILVHTGQHFDANMSGIFFEELQIQKPDYQFEIHSLSHGAMTGQMLESIEKVLLQEQPDIVLVYGDTNSTLAGALSASKLHIPVAHVEAGLRSYNRQMPEEINRVLTDHLADILFCPTSIAVTNLEKEGISNGVANVGDVMFDAFLFSKQRALKESDILVQLGIKKEQYCLVTVHRAENTGDEKRVKRLFSVFSDLATKDCPFVIPLHPRTKKILEQIDNFEYNKECVQIIPPVSYIDMIMLELNAKIILTDSGGVQKEAYFAETPCITLRRETEWVETVKSGYNVLVGTYSDGLCTAFNNYLKREFPFTTGLFGDGEASEKIVKNLLL